MTVFIKLFDDSEIEDSSFFLQFFHISSLLVANILLLTYNGCSFKSAVLSTVLAFCICTAIRSSLDILKA